MQVYFQPAKRSGSKNRQVKINFEQTIDRPVKLDEHAHLIEPSVLDKLSRLFPKREVPMWGTLGGEAGISGGKPGKGSPLAEFEAMKPGDAVFFTGDGYLYMGGTIALTWENEALAKALWGEDEGSRATWRFMFAIAGKRDFDNIPFSEIQDVIGWKSTRFPMAFKRLKRLEAERLLDHFSMEPELESVRGPDENDSDLYSGPTTRQVTREERLEQTRLRKHLLPGPTGECALCGREFPAALLVAAHIKKRSACSDKERRDFGKVAMLACRLGCDELFERGLITVVDGKIKTSSQVENWPDVATHINSHLGNRTISWYSARMDRFGWHQNHTFRKLGQLYSALPFIR